MRRHAWYLLSLLSLLAGCAAAEVRPAAQADKPGGDLALPTVQVGKDWQVMEKAPDLTDEHDRLPFQTERSLEPEGTRPATPAESQKIETQRERR